MKRDTKAKKPPKPKKATDLTRESESAAEMIARINAEWDDQPKLIDKAAVETLKLNNLIADLQRKKPPNFAQLIDDASKAKQAIQDGLNRPYTDYVKAQRESYAVQELISQGRDVDAAALQVALRLRKEMKPLDDEQLANIRAIAAQHEKIEQFLEAQRRVVGLYTGAVGDLRNAFDQAIEKAQDGDVGGAVKSLAGGYINTIKTLQRNILSETIFGGVDDAVQKYVRSITGQQTPAEIVQDHAQKFGTALDGLSDILERVTGKIGSVSAISPSGTVAANDNLYTGYTGQADYTGPDVVVTGAPKGNTDGQAMLAATKMSGVMGVIMGRIEKNLETWGIKIPTSITKGLSDPGVLKGMGIGQAAGGVFASITGGKSDPLASGIGGALGEKVGEKLTKPLSDVFGKTLGGFAGPLGGILGGVLGNVLGGLLNNPKFGTASVSLNQYGDVTGGAGAGNSDNAAVAATGLASSVASGINAIADQLGAKITNLAAVTVGNFDGKYRVATTNTSSALNYNNFNASTLKNFDSDQQAAIEYAIKYALSTSVVNGVSAASQNIIKSGADLQVSIQKALLIESVPKDLKAALDPVGAAIDDLNRKWRKTVDALHEGGATTEQMTQAQRLYQIQLDGIKNSTDSASQTLKDFQKSLKLGSDSPYSLRDQEGTAMTALKPFLDQIAGGQAIDQSKYQEAAKTFLDVERNLYGSTDKYFAALDAVQASTNQAISSIDNAVPITTAVPDPFTKATAASAAATATGVQAVAEIGTDTNTLLQQIAGLMAQVAANTGGAMGSSFIGDNRAFVNAA